MTNAEYERQMGGTLKLVPKIGTSLGVVWSLSKRACLVGPEINLQATCYETLRKGFG
ncbi:MAG: hypothetical protein ACETWQ_08670 [Phycisphaerae bacterium]